LDRIDILHIHDPDDHYEEALSGAYVALDRLRAEGVIRAVGAGMNQWQMLARFAREANFDCFLLAGRYTLLEQGALDEFLPLCGERVCGCVMGGPLKRGTLGSPPPGATSTDARADDAALARGEVVVWRAGLWIREDAAIERPTDHDRDSLFLAQWQELEAVCD